MATLYKDPNNPNWFARFKNSDGKRISRSTRTTSKRKAREIANDLEGVERKKQKQGGTLQKGFVEIIEIASREAGSGELTLARADDLIRRLHMLANPSFKIVSVEDHLGKWVSDQADHVSEKSLSTYKDMKRRMVTAFGPRIASMPIGDLGTEDVRKALKKITKTPIKGSQRTIKASTANMDLRALRRALRTAVSAGLAKLNAADDVRTLPEDDSTERAPFTVKEVRQLIDHSSTSDQWKGVIIIAAHTGLRLGDVTRISRDHLDGTSLEIRAEKTKRGKEILRVPLTPPCLQWIGDREGDLFPDMKGVKTGTLSTQFVRIMDRAGVPREITEAGDIVKRRSFHSLRHTFTSWLAEADVHSDVRQKLTGHKSAGVHARYTHHDEALDRAVAQLPDL